MKNAIGIAGAVLLGLSPVAQAECNEVQKQVLEKVTKITGPLIKSTCLDEGFMIFSTPFTKPYVMAIDKNGVIGACDSGGICIVPSTDAEKSLEYFKKQYEAITKGTSI